MSVSNIGSSPPFFSSPTKKRKTEELQINGSTPLEVMTQSLDYRAKCLNEFPKAIKLYYKAKDDPTFNWEALYGELSAAKEGVLAGNIEQITSFDELGFELESLLSATETGWVIFRTPQSKVCTFHILNPKETFKELFDYKNEELMFFGNILLKRTKNSEGPDHIELIHLVDQKILWNLPLSSSFKHILGNNILFLYDEKQCYYYNLNALKNPTPPIFSEYTNFEARILGGHMIENQEHAHTKNQYFVDNKLIFLAKKNNQRYLLVRDHAQKNDISIALPDHPKFDLDQNTCIVANYVVVRYISKFTNPQTAMAKIIVCIWNLEDETFHTIKHEGRQNQGLYRIGSQIYSLVFSENAQKKKFLPINVKTAQIPALPMDVPLDYLSFDGGAVVNGLITPKDCPIDKVKFFQQCIHRYSKKIEPKDCKVRYIFSEKIIMQGKGEKYFIVDFSKTYLSKSIPSSTAVSMDFFTLPSDIHRLFFHFLDRSELIKISLASKEMNACIEWKNNVFSRFPKAMKLYPQNIKDNSQIDWKHFYSQLALTGINMQNGEIKKLESLMNIGINSLEADTQFLSSDSGWVVFSYQVPNQRKQLFKFHILRPEETMQKVSFDFDFNFNLCGITNKHFIAYSTTGDKIHVVHLKTDKSWGCDIKNQLLALFSFKEKSILIYKDYVELRELNQDKFCCPTRLFSTYKNFELINQVDGKLVLFGEDPKDGRRKILIWDFQEKEEILPLDIPLCQHQKPKNVLFFEDKYLVQFLSKTESTSFQTKLLFFNINTQKALSEKVHTSRGGYLDVIDGKIYLDTDRRHYIETNDREVGSLCHPFEMVMKKAVDMDGVKIYDNRIIPNKVVSFFQNILETALRKSEKFTPPKIGAILFGKAVVCYENEILLIDFAPNK